MTIPWWGNVVLMLALIGAYKIWEHHVDQGGYNRADAVWQKKEADIKADAAEKLAGATNEARAREQKLLADMNGMSIIRFEENENHEKAIAGYVAAVRARDLKLSIAIDPRSLPQCATAADPATTGRSGAETRADVMPETAVDVLGIAGDIAKGVRDFNAVVDAYNRARETCNAGVSHGR